MTKKIPLSQGLYALVDDEDYSWLNQWKWCAVSTQRKSGGYAMRMDHGETISMHRLIMGAKEGEEIDHIDGRGLNNQKSNMRKATRRQGICNRGVFKNNQVGYKGVTLRKDGRWKMSITASYDTPEDAARAYDKAARIIFGEFARLNFPDSTL